MKEHLTRTEAAQRNGDAPAREITLNSNLMEWKYKSFFFFLGQHAEVYESHLALAKFFSEPDDMWLRHHFYELSLKAANKVEMDSGRREADANAHLAHMYLEQGNTYLHWNCLC